MASVAERNVVIFLVPRWRKAIKHEPVEENNMIAREFQREKRVRKVNVSPRGITGESYTVLQSVLSKNTNPVSGDRRPFSEDAACNSKICDCNTSKRKLSIRSIASRARARTQKNKLRIVIPFQLNRRVKLIIEQDI